MIIKAPVEKVIIGDDSQLDRFTVIYSCSDVSIVDNVMIALHCMIVAGNHDYRQTQLPMRFGGNVTNKPIVIEDYVWGAANCTITDGVRIGEGAVLAANSVITENVMPYDIVAGVPAKVIANRKRMADTEMKSPIEPR